MCTYCVHSVYVLGLCVYLCVCMFLYLCVINVCVYVLNMCVDFHCVCVLGVKFSVWA